FCSPTQFLPKSTHLLHGTELFRPVTELAVHTFDGGPDRFGNLLDVAPGHLQLCMAELGLDIARLTVLLKMCRARPPQRLISHIGDARALGQRLEASLEIIPQPERSAGLVRKK